MAIFAQMRLVAHLRLVFATLSLWAILPNRQKSCYLSFPKTRNVGSPDHRFPSVMPPFARNGGANHRPPEIRPPRP
ncbi:MAG: hypothetical protein OEM98_14045, partial [Gammaproteobacteria bacterium]|nr:hypothetical protein [Gammaproteobacteria bacterium]